MHKSTSLSKGAIYIIMSTLFSSLTGYILYFILARILGPESFGIYGVVIGMVTIIDKVMLTGVQQSVSKFISEKEESADLIKKKFLKVIFFSSLIIVSIYFLISKYIALLLNDISLKPYIQVSAFIIIPYCLYGVLQGYLNGLRFFRRQALIRIVYALIRFIMILLFVMLGFSVMGAIWGFALAVLLSFLLNSLLVGFGNKGNKEDVPSFKRIIRFMAPLISITVVISVLVSIGLFFVKALSPSALSNIYAGYFTAANSIAQIPYMLLAAFSIVLFPAISKATFNNNIERIANYIKQGLRYSLIFSVFIAVLISSTSSELISLLYGKTYLPAANTLSFLVFGFLLLLMLLVLTTIISSTGKPLHSTIIVLIAFIFAITLNSILVPIYSLEGAAIAMIISNFIAVIIASVYIKLKFNTFLGAIHIIRILFAGAIMYFISSLYPVFNIFIVFKYILITVVYFLILFGIRELNKKDIRRLLFKPAS